MALKVSKTGKRPRSKSVKKFMQYRDYHPRENFSHAFLVFPLKQRVAKLRDMYKNAGALMSAALELEDPYRPIESVLVDKMVAAAKKGDGKKVLGQFGEFALGCEQLFKSARETFSEERLSWIFKVRNAPKIGIEQYLHQLYHARESMFESLAAQEARGTISSAWRQIREQCKQF